ncbi:unnamed protein product [Arabis nemorensis]|uniref:AIG1-type G domain-containing protein n=1 Tax=Arabis nemorensis TaxID=586526 RepID=A0A565BDS8_9BRAS|nr:unnamed protein product [Arabis nemorensis]
MARDPNTTASSMPSSSELVINMVLVGRIGNGKSSSGNSILGKKVFKTKRQVMPVTFKCEMYSAALQDGPTINVVDSPGSKIKNERMVEF